MKYGIEIEYYDCILDMESREVLETEWTDLSVVRANCHRILEHNYFFKRYWAFGHLQGKKIEKWAKKRDWYLGNRSQSEILLLNDNLTPFIQDTFWLDEYTSEPQYIKKVTEIIISKDLKSYKANNWIPEEIS